MSTPRNSIAAHKNNLLNLKFLSKHDSLLNVLEKVVALSRIDHRNRTAFPTWSSNHGIHSQPERPRELLHIANLRVGPVNVFIHQLSRLQTRARSDLKLFLERSFECPKHHR